MTTPRAGNEEERWARYVALYAEAYALGRELSLDLPSPAPLALSAETDDELAPGGGMVLCSPHPDDELLPGALPYRLLREEGLAITNLALTLGSDPGRREERRLEVAAACQAIGFACQLIAPPLAFSRLTPAERSEDAPAWAEKVALLSRHFARMRPALVLCPHAEDGHQTHRGVHLLVRESLARHSAQTPGSIFLVESEFWRPLAEPNLMVGISLADAAHLLAALTCHRGELLRNPYHLRQPARWMDNVRRGGELLGGYGSGGSDFLFAELYRLSRFVNGQQREWEGGPLTIAPGERYGLAALLGREKGENN